MAYNIKDILGSINKDGWLTNNKFLVTVNPPAILQGSANISSLLQIRAEDCRMPGVSFTASDINRYGIGPLQKMPYNVQFTDTAITFIADKNGSIYKFFYEWFNGIFGFSSSNGNLGKYETEYKDKYSVDVNIEVYDNSSKMVQKITLHSAFPISLNETNLNWNQSNQMLKFTVTFSFRDWSLENVPSSGSQEPNQSPQPQSSIPRTSPSATDPNAPTR